MIIKIPKDKYKEIEEKSTKYNLSQNIADFALACSDIPNKENTQARASSYSPLYLTFSHFSDFSKQSAVLVYIDKNNPTQPKIIGIVSRDSFVKKCIQKDFGYGKKICLHSEELDERYIQ